MWYVLFQSQNIIGVFTDLSVIQQTLLTIKIVAEQAHLRLFSGELLNKSASDGDVQFLCGTAEELLQIVHVGKPSTSLLKKSVATVSGADSDSDDPSFVSPACAAAGWAISFNLRKQQGADHGGHKGRPMEYVPEDMIDEEVLRTVREEEEKYSRRVDEEEEDDDTDADDDACSSEDEVEL